ncbi:MAG: hypothetical protein ACJ746_07675 [Bryobacteraceae bacterium]
MRYLRTCNKRSAFEWLLAVAVILAGTALRAWHLDASAFWVDEAESSINALTILQNGYPTDTYLGMPIYENTFVWTWPESPEYEFRDISYSRKHFAIYHGWLPLYSIAASFALSGIQPDVVSATPTTRHTQLEQRERTRAGRLPAVLFGAVFLLVVFVGGKVMYGSDAGWAALLLGAVNPYHIELSRQARYYSAEVLLTTACCVVIWLLIRARRWKHVLLTALCLVLLFYTHLQSFLTAAVVLALVAPIMYSRDPGSWKKLAALAGLVAIGTVPWVIVTGFYQDQAFIPRAWTLLSLPGDLFRYPPANPWALVTGTLVVTLSAWLVCFKPGFSSRFALPLTQLLPVLPFLTLWAACGYVTFLGCIPAVSFTGHRMNLSYWGPLFLLFSALSAAMARAVSGRASPLAASVLMVAISLCTGHSIGLQIPKSSNWRTYEAIFRDLDAHKLERGTRIYSLPNAHLVLTFYSGLPIQDISPIRKSFLDSYPGEIVLIDPEATIDTGTLEPAHIQTVARESGTRMSSRSAQEWSFFLSTRHYRERMTKIIAPNRAPDLESLPPFAQQLVADHDSKAQSHFSAFDYELVTRGFEIRDWSDWVSVLKFRFVDPSRHTGAHVNYRDRLRGAEAVLLALREPVAIYYSHPSRHNGRTKQSGPVFEFEDWGEGT